MGRLLIIFGIKPLRTHLECSAMNKDHLVQKIKDRQQGLLGHREIERAVGAGYRKVVQKVLVPFGHQLNSVGTSLQIIGVSGLAIIGIIDIDISSLGIAVDCHRNNR